MTTIEISGREQLLVLSIRRYTEVSCGEMTFRLQSLTEAEKSRFEKSILTSKGAINHHIALGTDARSVTKPFGTVIVSVLFVSRLTFTPTP